MVVAGAAKPWGLKTSVPGGVSIPGPVFVDVVLASVWVQPLSFGSQSKVWVAHATTPELPLC